MNITNPFTVPEPIVRSNYFELTIQYLKDEHLTKDPLFDKLQHAIYYTKSIKKHLVAVAWLDGRHCFFISDLPISYSKLNNSDIARARLMIDNKTDTYPYLLLSIKINKLGN